MGYGKSLISNSMSPPVVHERKSSVHRKRSLSGSFGRWIPPKGRILEGLIGKTGRTCLPVEDISRIQNLVESKFVRNDSLPTTKICRTGNITESARKKAIYEYLRSDVERFRIGSGSEANLIPKTEEVNLESPTSAPVESFLQTFDFDVDPSMHVGDDVGLQADISDQEVDPNLAEVFNHMDNMQLDATPLSELERMKSLLPEVEKDSKGSYGYAGANPVSPANSLSSSSSKDSEDDPLTKKPLVAYNGIGQIRLWQFLVQCLANGEHGICWTNKKTLEFKFTHPDAIARGWGRIKNKDTMTYDKMSRSLRFYYRKNILTKVHDQKHVFQFHPSVQKVCGNKMQGAE